MKTTLLLIRHGESEANRQGFFGGQTDTPLTETGRRQAQITAEFLRHRHIDAFYASPLSRAYDTGLAAAAYHDLPVEKVGDLREIRGGEWETVSFGEIARRWPEDYRQWNESIGLSRCTGGESVIQVQQRVYGCLSALASRHPGQTLCVAVHAMVIRAFVGRVLQYPPERLRELPFPTNASVTAVEFESGAFRLVKYSEDDHMGAMKTAFPETI